MQLNVFTDYALRVLIFAAAHPQGRCTSDQVASAFGISRHHVVKVVNELQHLGYIETVRGRTGGFGLARPADQIGVGDVIRRTERTLALVECLGDSKTTCPLTPACGLRAALTEASDAFFAVLDRYVLSDFVAQPTLLARVSALRFVPAGGHLRA